MQQSLFELECPECHDTFNMASEMLQHLSQHAKETPTTVQCKQTEKSKQIPALRPITPKKLDPAAETYPLKFCEVTLSDETKELEEQQPKRTSPKKYECNVCSRNFGWSTDLKRHILTHTGERPFRCKLCDSTFTRNFLLQKHMLKSHSGEKSRIPDLKPIRGLKQKSRKQEKYKIKRKMFDKGVYESEKGYELKTDILCSS